MTPKIGTFICNGSLHILTAVLSMTWLLGHSPTQRQKTLPTVITQGLMFRKTRICFQSAECSGNEGHTKLRIKP